MSETLAKPLDAVEASQPVFVSWTTGITIPPLGEKPKIVVSGNKARAASITEHRRGISSRAVFRFQSPRQKFPDLIQSRRGIQQPR